MDIIVTGSLSYDFIMDFPGRFIDRIMPDKIHNISLSFLVDKLSKQFGGTAGNIAYNLKLFEYDPLILSPIGSDALIYLQFLKSHHIQTSGIPIYKNVGTSSYFVITDQEDNQIGSFYIGAMKYAKDISITQYVKHKNTFIIISPNDPQAMIRYITECRKSHYTYLFDPAFQISMLPVEELRKGITGAQICIGNDYEIALIEKTLSISHEELICLVPLLITTLGSEGSIIETRKERIHIRAAKPARVSDPTGAGDAYRAGFIAGYVQLQTKKVNFSMEKLNFSADELAICGQMGSVAAVYTVEKYGTVTHTFTVDQFKKRYFENYHTNLQL